jgi:DNA-binding Xre family transcriptional regulator
MGRGRPICLDTKLGQIMKSRGYPAYEVAVAANFSPRLMTEYLAGRRILRTEHIAGICKFLNVEPEDIIEPELTHDLTRATGVPIDPTIRSVLDLPKMITRAGIPTTLTRAIGMGG